MYYFVLQSSESCREKEGLGDEAGEGDDAQSSGSTVVLDEQMAEELSELLEEHSKKEVSWLSIV